VRGVLAEHSTEAAVLPKTLIYLGSSGFGVGDFDGVDGLEAL
jgi:hypothetical protein